MKPPLTPLIGQTPLPTPVGGLSSALVRFGVKVPQHRKAVPATLDVSASTVIRGLLASLSWRLQRLRRRLGMRLLSDQLSDYWADDPHIQAPVHA